MTSAFPIWPHFAEDEIAAAEAVLRSGRVNYWTGTEGRSFEREYAAALGIPYAVALANGTVALELALAMLEVGPGHEVITTPRTFIASASCIVMRGAKPVFVDVDRDSQNITAASIEPAITPLTKAILVVHLAGWPCEMADILRLARSRNLAVIEDCAQANGAMYRGGAVGTFGVFGAFSFCQDKIVTTGGEGGLLVTNDEALWSRAWSFKDHGKGLAAMQRTDPAGFRWVHDSFGTNWRMTEMQAAIGRIQLTKLPAWVARRRENAALLREGLKDVAGLRIPQPGEHIGHAYTSITYSWTSRVSKRVGRASASSRRSAKEACLVSRGRVPRYTWSAPSTAHRRARCSGCPWQGNSAIAVSCSRYIRH